VFWIYIDDEGRWCLRKEGGATEATFGALSLTCSREHGVFSEVGAMQLPLQITFKKVDPSETIEASVRSHAARLDPFFGRIMRCHVVVAAPQRRQRKGRLYNIRINLTVPQHEIVVNREPLLDHAYEDVEVAVREAFNAAARQLATASSMTDFRGSMSATRYGTWPRRRRAA
jgi:hypothetical protein